MSKMIRKVGQQWLMTELFIASTCPAERPWLSSTKMMGQWIGWLFAVACCFARLSPEGYWSSCFKFTFPRKSHALKTNHALNERKTLGQLYDMGHVEANPFDS